MNDRHLDRIRPSTTERVRRVAIELGYRRNALARAIVTGRNPVIGFLVQDPAYEPWARLLTGALAEAEEQAYFIKVMHLRTPAEDSNAIERCLDARLAGIIGVAIPDQRVVALHDNTSRYGVPLAVLDGGFQLEWGLRVVSDDRQGSRLAIDHLVSLGHSRIALLSGNPADAVCARRELGYLEAMSHNGLEIPEGYLLQGYWSAAYVEKLVEALLTHPGGRPTAILCSSDETAMVAMRFCRRLGVEVPGQMSVIGFSNLVTSQYCDPALTTVAPPFESMGRSIVRQLIGRISESAQSNGDFDDSVKEESLETQLITRDSTAPAPAH